jgi:hypothetical protein
MKTYEMNKLEEYLRDHSYMYGRTKIWDGEQIIVYGESVNDIRWDAICCSISYGGRDGLLEVMGDIVPEDDNDGVIGYLTAKDVIELIEKKK